MLRVQGLGLSVQGLGLRVYGLRSRNFMVCTWRPEGVPNRWFVASVSTTVYLLGNTGIMEKKMKTTIL